MVGALYHHYGTKGSPYVAVAWRLAAPGRAVENGVGFSVAVALDADDGIVIIDEVAVRNVSQPVGHLCALSRAALCREGIRHSVVAHHRGVDEKSVKVRAGESIGEHQGIVEGKAHRRQTAADGHLAVRELLRGLEQRTGESRDVADHKLIASRGKTVNTRHAIAGIDIANETGILYLLQFVHDGKIHQRLCIRGNIRLERYERRQDMVQKQR